MSMQLSAFSFIAFLGISVFITGCKNPPGTPGVSLARQFPVKEIGGPGEVEILKGSVIEYLGEASPDSSMVKIKFDGNTGWVPKESIVWKAKPGVVTGARTRRKVRRGLPSL